MPAVVTVLLHCNISSTQRLDYTDRKRLNYAFRHIDEFCVFAVNKIVTFSLSALVSDTTSHYTLSGKSRKIIEVIEQQTHSYPLAYDISLI